MIHLNNKNTKERFDSWAKNYDRSIFSGFFNYVQHRVIKSLNPKKGDKILDIGCGTGILLDKINRIIDNEGKLVGIDLSEEMIKEARKKRTKNIDFLVSNAAELKFEDNYFDAVTNTISFHHYPNQLKTLGEINRVLKPEGKLYLADHSFSYPPGFVYMMNPLMNLFEGPIKINGRRKMKKMLKETGFNPLSVNNLAFIASLYIAEKN